MQQVTAGDPLAEFREKVVERLKGEIGALLPDEALAELTKRAVDEQFFQPRMVEVGDSYNRRTERRPSWFEEAVTAAAKPLIEAEVKRILVEQEEPIRDAVTEALEPNRLLLVAAGLIGDTVREAMQGYHTGLMGELRNAGLLR